MTEAEKKKMRAKAAKLSNPKPVELPSGAWRCEKMVNGVRIRETDKDPSVAHARVNAIAAGLIAASAGTTSTTFGAAYDALIEKNRNIFSPSTILGYNRIMKNHLHDFKILPMSAITQERIQRRVNELAKRRAPKTVRNVYGLITSVYYDFYPDRKLSVNLPEEYPNEIQIPSEDEIRAIVKTCRGTQYELPILLAMQLGLRASEIRGLKWEHIEDGRIHICQAIVEGEDGATTKKPKKGASQRWLYIPPEVQALLAVTPHTSEYIVTMTGQAMGKGFTRICQKAGIKHYRFHDLRHVFASVSISLNVPTEYIRKDMGHKSDRMLKAVYGHMMEERRKEHADRRAQYYEDLTS